MILSDGDFEFVFGMYDSAIELLPEKEKSLYAESVIEVMLEHGIELKHYIKEISDHCEYLSEAIDAHFEQEEEDEDLFEDFNEDDYEDWEQMSVWYSKVTANMGEIVNAISHFEKEIDQAKYECGMKGNLEKQSRDMPGIVEHRFNQLQEVEAILEYLNTEMRKLRSKIFRKYLENYNRALSSRDAEKFVDGEDDVVNLQYVINDFSLVRNKFIGVIKALEAKQFQINNIVKLRAAGLEDITL